MHEYVILVTKIIMSEEFENRMHRSESWILIIYLMKQVRPLKSKLVVDYTALN